MKIKGVIEDLKIKVTKKGMIAKIVKIYLGLCFLFSLLLFFNIVFLKIQLLDF